MVSDVRTLRDIEFLLYSRAAGSEPDPALTEAHWTYMDQFADRMIARGPTLAPDRVTWTGSLHIVDLPNADAAREFVEREPYNRAGLFDGHLIRRFKNVLGGTMWDFPREPVEPRFVVIAHIRAPAGEPVLAVPQTGFTSVPRERLIIHGELFTPDKSAPAGAVLALEAPTRELAGTILSDGLAGQEKYFDIEIHDWEFGGRR
jgi:uncharacterized protein YciI